ncbi:MAG TPA: hypothetical protein VE727_01925 [Solirubrobacterales bacterium]|jgi:hypothetical protein|nr:hypothetical protein [Solirubrobacterales bacterium]
MTAANAGSEAPGQDRAEAVAASVRAGLDLLGLKATDDETAVIQAADGLYHPLIERLLKAEFDGVDPEPGVDVSGPPRALEQR